MVSKQELSERFPLVAPLITNDNLAALQQAQANFFKCAVFYKEDRAALNLGIGEELKKLSSAALKALTSDIHDLTKKDETFKKVPNRPLAEVIPDLLLLLLSQTPETPKAELDAKSCVRVICAFCEARNISKDFLEKKSKTDKYILRKKAFLAEYELPGILIKIPGLDEDKLDLINANIGMLKQAVPRLSVDAIERGLLESLGLLERNRLATNHSAYHPSNQFLYQQPNFVNTFPLIVRLEWSKSSLEHIQKRSTYIFSRNIQEMRSAIIKEAGAFSNDEKDYLKKLFGVDAVSSEVILDAVLLIITTYSLEGKTSIASENEVKKIAMTCKRIIECATYIDTHEKKIQPPMDARKLKCYQHYFIKLYQNPALMKEVPQSFNNIDQLEIYLHINTKETELEQSKSNANYARDFAECKKLFPTLSDVEIKEAIKIKNGLLKPIFYTTDLTSLQEPFYNSLSSELKDFLKNQLGKDKKLPEYIFDAVTIIIIRYNLNDYTKTSTDNKSILTQCHAIVQAAYNANNASSNEQNIALMTQIDMLMPQGYEGLKRKKTAHLKEALSIIKTRGTKSDDEVRQAISLIGSDSRKKEALNAMGITGVRSYQVNDVFNIAQMDLYANIIKPFLASGVGKNRTAEQIGDDILSAFKNAKGNPQLFELYLYYPNDRYLQALDQTSRISEDRKKLLPFENGAFYSQALLIQHYLKTDKKQINFDNKGSHPNVFALAQCITLLTTRAQREEIVAYFNENGDTHCFEYFNNALEVIQREQQQINPGEVQLLIQFLIAKTKNNSIGFDIDDLNIIDLCEYYNAENSTAPIGLTLIENRKRVKEMTLGKIAEKITALFEGKNLNEKLEVFRDELSLIYYHYLDNPSAIYFIEQYIKNEIKVESDVDLFYQKLNRAHLQVLALKDKSLLELEFHAPNANIYAHIINTLDKTTPNFYERIRFAILFTNKFAQNHDMHFKFAVNHPNIANQCLDFSIDELNQILALSDKPNAHDLMQLKIFLIQIENEDDEADFDDLMDRLTGTQHSSSSAPLLSSAPVTAGSSRNPVPDAQTLKRYIAAFYLIDNSAYDPANKQLLKRLLAKNLNEPFVYINDTDVINIKSLAQKLSENQEDALQLIDLNDNWTRISEKEAKIFNGIFNQPIHSKADLVYAFYYFAQYPARTPQQEYLFNGLKHYLQTNDRLFFCQMIVDTKLDNGDYAKELKALNQDKAIANEINRRVTDVTTQNNLLQFFKKYPFIATAVSITNPDWTSMYNEINAFIQKQTVSVSDMALVIEIALTYPGLLAQLHVPADLKGYRRFATDFGHINNNPKKAEMLTDDASKRLVIIELCKNPNYKRDLLKALGLNRRFQAKPHHKNEQEMRDELLAIHFEYGQGLASYFHRFNDDDFGYVSCYTRILDVKKKTDQYLKSTDIYDIENDSTLTIDIASKNKNESFLIQLHLLSYSIASDRIFTLFVMAHMNFSKLSLALSHAEMIRLRFIIVELEIDQPGLMKKFAEEASSNTEQAVHKYTYLHQLRSMRNMRNISKHSDFENNTFFIIYSAIQDSAFLSKREKYYLCSMAIDNQKQYPDGFGKLVQMFGIYPLLLQLGLTKLIKKHSQALNGKIGLKDHKKLPRIQVKINDLLQVANKTQSEIAQLLRQKETDKLHPITTIASANEETDKFFSNVFPGLQKNTEIYKRLNAIEREIPGVLDEIHSQFADGIDKPLFGEELTFQQKLAWLNNLLFKLEHISELTPSSEKDDLYQLVAPFGNDPDFYTRVDHMLLNSLNPQQRVEVGGLLPDLIQVYYRYPDVIDYYINENKAQIKMNPSFYYNQIIKVIKQLPVKAKDNDALTLAALKYPGFISTFNIDLGYINQFNYAFEQYYKKQSDSLMNDDMACKVLYCLQFAKDRAAIDAFATLINSQSKTNKITHKKTKVTQLAKYLEIIQSSLLNPAEKHELSQKLFSVFSHAHEKFLNTNLTLEEITEIAGWNVQTSPTYNLDRNLVQTLNSRLVMSDNSVSYENLTFQAGFSLNTASSSASTLVMSAEPIHFVKPFKSGTKDIVHNTVIRQGGCLYYTAGTKLKGAQISGNTVNDLYLTQNNDTEKTRVTIKGPALAQMQMMALMTVYNEFTQKASAAKPGVNFLRYSTIEPSYSKGFKKDVYYDVTTWTQENIAAATCSLIAHDSSKINDVYQGRQNDPVLKLNAAAQLFSDGLHLCALFYPRDFTYQLQMDGADKKKLVIYFSLETSSKVPKALENILAHLSQYNDLKQFNHGLFSHDNLRLIAKLWGVDYYLSRDNIATLMSRYKQNNVHSAFGDCLEMQLGLYLRGEIDQEMLIDTLLQANASSNDPKAQAQFLRHMKAFKAGPSDTHHAVLSSQGSSGVRSGLPVLQRQNTVLSSQSNFDQLTF